GQAAIVVSILNGKRRYLAAVRRGQFRLPMAQQVSFGIEIEEMLRDGLPGKLVQQRIGVKWSALPGNAVRGAHGQRVMIRHSSNDPPRLRGPRTRMNYGTQQIAETQPLRRRRIHDTAAVQRRIGLALKEVFDPLAAGTQFLDKRAILVVPVSRLDV